LTEATFLLRRSAHRARLRDFLTEFSVLAYRTDDELHLWDDVFDWLARYEAHDPDWTDGYLAVVSGRERRFKSLDVRPRVSVGLAAARRHANPARGGLSRLLKKAHLLRWRPRPHAQRTGSTPRVRPAGAASHLDLFEQPAGFSATCLRRSAHAAALTARG